MPTLTEIEAEQYKRSFSRYARGAWHLVEPATPYIHNWHIDLVQEVVTAIKREQLRNVIINIPPRHMKSLLVSVFFPTWLWTDMPTKRFLCGSYAQDLAVRDALKSRRIIQSNWYQQHFGDVFQLTGDQNVKARYENDKTGYRISTGVGGLGTGEGGDIILIDDALNADDADSDAKRDGANEWFDGTISTRGNDPKKVVKIVIMQRLHEDDLTGHILEKMKEPGAEQYEHIVLPAEYEPRRFFSSIGLKDPRTQEGELLWPERFGKPELAALKVNLTERGVAGQLQQRPAPKGGAIFKTAWWEGKNRYSATDKTHSNLCIARWLSFDTALKDGEENDYTGETVFELQPDYRLTTRRVWWEKLQFPQLVKTIEDEGAFWNYDEKLRGVIIEDKGSGTTALQTIRQSARTWLAALLVDFMPSGSKEYRARQASLWCERGCVLLPEPDAAVPWLYDFTGHLFKFPGAAMDDDVDSFVQGILYLEHLLAEGWRARMHEAMKDAE